MKSAVRPSKANETRKRREMATICASVKICFFLWSVKICKNSSWFLPSASRSAMCGDDDSMAAVKLGAQLSEFVFMMDLFKVL